MAGMYSAITQTTISGAAGASETTLSVADASGFPDADADCRAYIVAVSASRGGGSRSASRSHP